LIKSDGKDNQQISFNSTSNSNKLRKENCLARCWDWKKSFRNWNVRMAICESWLIN